MENLEGISNGQGNIAYTWRELEVPQPDHWSGKHVRRRLQEIAEAAERYAEESTAVRDETEGRTARTSAVRDLNGASTDGVTVYNPGSAVATWTEICTADNARSRKLSAGDAITDRYREMEKRVEEQDRTIAELKGIIENLQDLSLIHI
ncbi:hypothetical protein [Megasphaera elsdenii]|uniref:hypothetical protein n=1 Tax=Megasphaera elsdenii TaxID=907 RepID=UPI00242DBD4B|nr:hypothetical protein [Megasphaera elsdenii]